MFKEYFDINISENIETIIVYLYESGEQQKKFGFILEMAKKISSLSQALVREWQKKEWTKKIMTSSLVLHQRASERVKLSF